MNFVIDQSTNNRCSETTNEWRQKLEDHFLQEQKQVVGHCHQQSYPNFIFQNHRHTMQFPNKSVTTIFCKKW